jgi:hypothetical protein
MSREVGLDGVREAMTAARALARYLGDEVAAAARHERRAEAIADAETRLMASGRPARLAEIRVAHQETTAQMAAALGATERALAVIEAAGLAGDRDRVAAYLAVLALRLDGDTACAGDTRIPLA